MKMKNRLTLTACCALLLLSCDHVPDKTGTAKNLASLQGFGTAPIPMDTANKMLDSYLQSIGYADNDTDLHSFVVDADKLRYYLDSTQDSENITGLKIMLAHTRQYINSGHANEPAGYRSGALTIIIAAFDIDGNYRFLPGNAVLDYTSPCPPVCPTGDAASSLISN